MLFSELGQASVTLYEKNKKEPSLLGLEKKVTKVTQARISRRLKGKVKFSWRLLSNVIFAGATECPPKYEGRRR